MSKIIKWTTLLGVILSMWTVASGKICPDKKVTTYSIYRVNSSTGRLITELKIKETRTFVCCDGYRETGRMFGGLQPKCDPICEPVCGNGTCYSPNKCSCDLGFTHSSVGSCVVDETMPVQYTAKQSSTKLSTPSYQVASTQKIHLGDISQSDKPTEPIYTTEQTNSTTANFIPSRVLTTTRRSRTVKCGTCDQGTCVDGTCFCAIGYKRTQEGNCQPMCSQSCLNGRCVEPNRCECIDRYIYDSESLQCKPLCNGKIYGCIRGTCVGYNQCRCDNGTVLQKDELFDCVDRYLAQPISAFPWFFLLLLLPLVAVVASFCIIISRWKSAKAKRVQGQEESFSEVRFHNARNEHSSTEDYQKACSKDKYVRDDPSCSQGTIRRNGNVLIINT